MLVTQVSLRPTDAAANAGRPALTPELLAATGARYSRSNQGLQSIIDKIDPDNLDASVDGIFRMLDYGHQSIADMAPVAIFMDGISLHLAYFVWSLCPTAAGQESSTRYINYAGTQNLSAVDSDEWRSSIAQAFAHYERALEIWTRVAHAFPTRTRIPQSLRDDPTKAKAVARMERNFAFDRARVFLPAAAPTNMMLVMPARGWAQLCAHLSSFPLPEAQELAAQIRPELELAAPRLVKHASAKVSLQHGWQQEIARWQNLAQTPCKYLQSVENREHPPTPHLQVLAAPDDEFSPVKDLQFHDNRYGWVGSGLARTAVRFGWEAVALAEIRDLNRHRTGTKWCPPVPQGFYAALDEWPSDWKDGEEDLQTLQAAEQFGAQMSQRSRELIGEGDTSAVYWNLLGTQFRFEHTTTADKFLYEAELRTGVGAHYRYARHLRDVLALWYQEFPETRGLVLEGSAEPE